MSVSVPEGEHIYEMKFFPAWMNYGLYIAAASFIALLLFMIIWKKHNLRYDIVTEDNHEQEKSSISGDIGAIETNISEFVDTNAKENTK